MPSLSLQAHLVSAQPQLSAVSVDPRGFKTAIQSLTDFLIEHKIAANLWLKLPKDDAWWTDVWQYGRQATGCNLYTLGEQTGEPPDDLVANLHAISIESYIEQNPQLKREYLCLAIADDFVGVLLAARRQTPTGDKRTLQLYSSLCGNTALAISTGLEAIIEQTLQQAETSTPPSSGTTATATTEDSRQPSAEQSSENSAATEQGVIAGRAIAGRAILDQWAECFPISLATRSYQPLTDAYVAWQLQQQEALRLQLASYRNAEKEETGRLLSDLSPDFLSQAGRELQSPLTTIKTALTLLGSPTLKLAQRQRYLEMISNQCDRQQALISNVIDLLQIHATDASSIQPLQLANLIPGIVSTYQPIAEERGIMLAYTVPQTLSEVSGSESELKQVVIHLLNNGIQITPKGGRVWVAAAPHDADFIALTVQDSGTGMNKADTTRLFDAFYRNGANGEEGTGLGLTLVQQLVKRMGGSVSVDSAPGQGTTFKILLPVNRTTSRPTASETVANTSTLSSAQSASTSQTATRDTASAGVR